jgi:cyclopropane-fatty-acyl-phospholipid synthase
MMPGILQQVFVRMSAGTAVPFAVVFSDGSEFRSGDTAPAWTMRFRTAAAERRTVLFGHIGLVESYLDGTLDIEGSLASACRAGMDATFDASPNRLVQVRNRWHEVRFSNASRTQARANARFHYGLPADFFRLWLDVPAMMYTCGYWKEGTRTLEEAQANKIEHVCRKVQLAPGERVIDIGCGFGGFMFQAWERYRTPVTGLNTTPEQVEWLRAEIGRRGLGEHLSVVEADFRDIPGEFDKSISIGTLEHAGRDQLFEVVQAHARSVKPGGLGMLHFIGHVGRYETEFYIRKHVFPGGWIPSLAETIEAMERCGLEVVDIENLRPHYALTLDAWADRFDHNWEKIRALDPQRFTERFRRNWRTYLYGCAEMFRSPKGYTHLFQIIYSRGNVGADYPMSRAFLYREPPPAG